MGYGELCWAQNGVHICLLHHLLCQLDTTSLGEQLPEGGGKNSEEMIHYMISTDSYTQVPLIY